MANTTCPACGERAISSAGKFFRGPWRRFRCASCGARLTVSTKDLVMLPLIVVPLLLVQYTPAWGGALLLVGFLAACWLHQSWVPLVPAPDEGAG